MAVELLFRRGNTLSNDAFTGKAGSITIDTELKQLRVHDGVTAGGFKVPTGAELAAVQDQLAALGIADIAGLQAALDLINGDATALEARTTTLEGDVTALETNKIDVAEKAAVNGVATLDANGKVPMSQLSDSVVGQVEYKGIWDASTNTPTLPATPETKGEYYVASVAGTFGSLTFEVGDWIISDGVKWDKVDNTDAVSSVNGQTGVITLTKADIGLDQVDNTSDAAKPVSTAQQAALDLKADISYVDTAVAAAGAIDSISGTAPVQVNVTDPKNPVISVDAATGVAPGLMSAADKAKLDSVSATAAVDSVNGRTGAVVLTAADVGLDQVVNQGLATQVEAEEGTVDTAYATPLSVRQFIEAMGFVQDENGDWSTDQGML